MVPARVVFKAGGGAIEEHVACDGLIGEGHALADELCAVRVLSFPRAVGITLNAKAASEKLYGITHGMRFALPRPNDGALRAGPNQVDEVEVRSVGRRVKELAYSVVL